MSLILDVFAAKGGCDDGLFPCRYEGAYAVGTGGYRKSGDWCACAHIQ